MIYITGTVKYHVNNALFLCLFCKCKSNLLGCFAVAAVFCEALVVCGSGAKCLACFIVDELCIDVLSGTEYAQTGTLRSPVDFVSDAIVVGYINESKGDYDIVAVLRANDAAFVEAYGKGYSQGQVEAEFARAVENTNATVQSYKRIHFFVERREEFDKNSSRKIRRAGVAEDARADYLRKLARN